MSGSVPTPIAIAVVEHRGCFLIGRRGPGTALAGLWEFPGGKVRSSAETLEQAAVRECHEETGIRVRVLHAYPDRVQQYDHGCVRLHFFACVPVDDGAPPKPPFQWVDRADLPRHEFPAGNRGLLQQLGATANGS